MVAEVDETDRGPAPVEVPLPPRLSWIPASAGMTTPKVIPAEAGEIHPASIDDGCAPVPTGSAPSAGERAPPRVVGAPALERMAILPRSLAMENGTWRGRTSTFRPSRG